MFISIYIGSVASADATEPMIGKNTDFDDEIYQKRARLDLEILLLEIEIGIQDINSLVPLCKRNFEKLIKSKK